MQFKLVAVLFALAQVAPLAQAIPVDSAPAAQGDDFMCVSETSFSLGGEVIECAPGTYCKDVGDRGGSPCVSESSGGSCPMDMDDTAPDATADAAMPSVTQPLGDANVTADSAPPAATGNSTIVAESAATGNSTMPAATNDTAIDQGPGEQTSDAAATTDTQASAATATDVVNTLTDAASASGVETLTDAAPSVIAAAYRPHDGRPDWQAPPGAPNTQDALPTTTALVPAAPAASSSVVPPLDANAALATAPAPTAALSTAVVPTEVVPAVTTAAAAVVPADSTAATGEITAGDITFNPAKQGQTGACGQLMTMARHVALCESRVGILN